MNELITTNQNESLFSKENFEHAFRVAKMISTTQLIPKAYFDKPADIMVAFEFGRTLGLGQLQALQNIAVINGRPCLWGDAMLALCQSHNDFEYIKETPILNEKSETVGFECAIKRKSYPEETKRTFTIDDAKKAGLLGKSGTWSTYTNRMYQMRARGFALRDSFADALGGFQVAEEVQDYEEKDVTPIKNKVDMTLLLANKQKPNLNVIDKETGEILNAGLTEKEQAEIIAKEMKGE